MAGYEQREMSGILFKNDKKTGENHPDYRGSCKINGAELEVAAWIKQGKASKFLSLKFSEPWKPERQTDQPVDDSGFKPQANPGTEEDIPFRAEDLPTFSELRQSTRG